MRSLFVAGKYPWPATDGYSLRMGNMILALAEAGPVDLFVAHGPDAGDLSRPPVDVRLVAVPVEISPRSVRVRRWVREGLPRIMLNRTCDAARARLAEVVAGGDYDVTCVSHVDTWWYFRDLLPAPVVVDLDNLEHIKTRAGRRVRPVGLHPTVWGRWILDQPLDMVDERRLERLQLTCAAEVDLVTLCSELDVERSGMANAVSVPNGYEVDWDPPLAPTPLDPERPVFSFVGLQSYAPNADASRWMATEVLPRIRRSIPGAEFRVVGRGGETLGDLRGLPGVTVTGGLEDLRPEMERADVMVVPIRFGAGTRLKVVEALGNRIPLVTTTVGCEGIEVVDGTHGLVVDDAEGFARACVRLVHEPDFREALVAEGGRLFERRYAWSIIRARFVEIIGERGLAG